MGARVQLPPTAITKALGTSQAALTRRKHSCGLALHNHNTFLTLKHLQLPRNHTGTHTYCTTRSINKQRARPLAIRLSETGKLLFRPRFHRYAIWMRKVLAPSVYHQSNGKPKVFGDESTVYIDALVLIWHCFHSNSADKDLRGV